MTIRWIGAALVLIGCSSWGISLANAYRKQEAALQQLSFSLQTMRWELSYRLTPLPDLFRQAGKYASGNLRTVFYALSKKLEENEETDAYRCMSLVLQQHKNLPPKAKRILKHLGSILGRYDLEGQLEGMDMVIRECEQEKRQLRSERDNRMRNYRTLGICAGFALVVLFI